MEAMEVVKAAAKSRGKPITSIGPSLGYASNYVSGAISRGSCPQANTLANMLAVCGYRLCAVPAESTPSEALVIDADVPLSTDIIVDLEQLRERREKLLEKQAKYQEKQDQIQSEIDDIDVQLRTFV